jgi:3-oxoacyl-[acyl-carrier protein] reductase
VLLNNAGITVDGEFGNTTRADRGRVIDVNLGGVSDCTHCPFEDVRGSEQGRPINDSSVAGQRGNCGRTDHATTGSGPSGSTRIVVLGSARSGSTADHVAPAFVRTDTLETVPDRVKRRTVDRVPLGRFAEVEDVGGIVRFLASEAYTTGQILAINGGVER